jgi:hypothetical protein
MNKKTLEVTVVTSTNLNKKYLDCVPFYIDFWLDQNQSSEYKYFPLVVVVAENMPSSLEDYLEYCVLQEPILGVSDVFVSQFIRALYSPFCNSDLVITSDVDMLPMSTRVMDQIISTRQPTVNSFDVCRDVLPEGQYAICYNIATPATWRDVVGLGDISELPKMIYKEYNRALERNSGYVSDHGGKGWFTDQEFLFSAVKEFTQRGGVIRKFTDSQTGHSRFDRLFLPFPINWMALPWVLVGTFTDYHIHHPVRRFRIFLKVLRQLLRIRTKK